MFLQRNVSISKSLFDLLTFECQKTCQNRNVKIFVFPDYKLIQNLKSFKTISKNAADFVSDTVCGRITNFNLYVG